MSPPENDDLKEHAARFNALPAFQRPAHEEHDVPMPGAPLRLPNTPQIARAAAPRATDVPAALRWESNWEQPYDGTSIITRRMSRCLDQHGGLPVFLPAAGGRMRGELDDRVLKEVETMLDRTPKTMPVQLFHVVPSEMKLRSVLYPSASFEFDQAGAETRHPRMILFSVWEQLTKGPWTKAPMAVYLRKFAAHIVPCEMNRQLLLHAGVPAEKIHVIHHPFDDHEAAALQKKRAARDPRAPVSFYSIGKWEPRKDPMTVLRAFLRARRSKDQVAPNSMDRHGTLTFYTSDWWQQAGYPTVAEALAAACQQTGTPLGFAEAVVSFVTKPQPSMVDVHRSHDVFVTASCGEAWGMPAFDSVVAGNLTLAPRWGGFAEYLPEDGALPFQLVDAHPAYHMPFGREKGQWARVDEDALAARMSALMTKGAARTGAPYSEENFARQNPIAVGKQLRAVVDQVVGKDYPWRGVP